MLKVDFTGSCKVFRRDVQTANGGTFPVYSTSIGKKRQDGTWANKYINLGFRKGVELENMADIEINDGFLTLDEVTKDGVTNTYWKIMVMDFNPAGEFAEMTRKRAEEERPPMTEVYASADEEEIPF